MATDPDRLMTAEEFYTFANRPENAGRRLELDEGKVIEVSSRNGVPLSGKAKGLVCANLTAALWDYARRNGRGYASPNDSLEAVEYSSVMCRPDVAFRDDGLADGEPRPEERDPFSPPKLVAFVLSPSDRYGRTVSKVALLLNAGVGLVLVIDPPHREVTVYRPDRDPTVVPADGVLDGGDLLPGLSVPVADLFRGPAEK